MEKVFQPNLTTDLIIKASQNYLKNKKISSYLELGCGGGEITFKNIKLLKNSKVVITDISDLAIKTAKEKFKQINFNIDARVSNLYSNIQNDEKFDLIISDVASISDIFLKQTKWYDGVSCNTGKNGLFLIKKILNNAHKYLNNNGSIIYPVLSLSSEIELLNIAKKKFRDTVKLEQKEWPYEFHDKDFVNKLEAYKLKGLLNYKFISGLHVFKTSIYQSFI